MKENAEKSANKKTFIGKVVSTKMDKTAVVQIERMIKHPIYKKHIKKSRRLKAHDANNQAVLGSIVKIIECRPLSRDKTFRILRAVGKES